VSEIDFSGDLHLLREAVASDPVVATLSSERRADLVFAVNEVATNAVRHGDGICTTRLWRDGRAVVAELRCTSMLDAAAGRRRPSPDALAGRGLWLVNQLCDLVELRSAQGGTTVRLHVRGGLDGSAVGKTSAGSAA
jgi:anti-sigma regulatory factor (Ser/Thr protein kinase)